MFSNPALLASLMGKSIQNAAFALIGDEASGLALDFLADVYAIRPNTATGAASSFVTFSRASTATRVNASGLIETVSANTPRLDYEPVTLAPRGLLVEEQRTNLLVRSAEFDNASWVKSNATVTANSTVSPAGTTDADTVKGTTAGSINYILQSVVATAVVYTYSIWVMAGTATSCVLLLRDSTAATNLTVTAAILSGPGSVSGTAGVTVSGLSTTQWTRVAITTTAAATSGNTIQAWFYPETSSASTTAKSNIIWGAQLEAGSFATSYIPTLAVSATRSADVASVATSSFPYSASEGTLVSSIKYGAFTPSVLTNTVGLGQTTGLTDGAYFLISTNLLAARVRSGNSDSALITSGASPTGIRKMALATKVDDFAFSVDGGAVLTDTSGPMPVGVTHLRMPMAPGGAYWIRQITYIPRRLTNAELQTRST